MSGEVGRGDVDKTGFPATLDRVQVCAGGCVYDYAATGHALVANKGDISRRR